MSAIMQTLELTLPHGTYTLEFAITPYDRGNFDRAPEGGYADLVSIKDEAGRSISPASDIGLTLEAVAELEESMYKSWASSPVEICRCNGECRC